jgi:hypothetical protein
VTSVKRRSFLAGGLAGAALPRSTNTTIRLANDQLAWHLEVHHGRLHSTRLENRLSGTSFELTSEGEFALVVSAARQRIEIPWWQARVGAEDTAWCATDNLCLRGLGGMPKVRYEGSALFRHEFELDAQVRGEPIVFVLGGYDYHDWQEYRVEVNGREIGHQVRSGRWRTPGQYAVRPGTTAHEALRFGGAKNLLDVHTRGYDRHFGGWSDAALEQVLFDPVLVDQFITVGEPYARIEDFEVEEILGQSGDRATVRLRSRSRPISVTAHYELRGPTRRKWVEIQNGGAEPLLLLDIELDRVRTNAATSEGGHGDPVLLGGETFWAVEHPAGVNQGSIGEVLLWHCPGRRVAAGENVVSSAALVGVTGKARAIEGFHAWIASHSPRRNRLVSVYDPFGINNQWGMAPTLDDEEMLDSLRLLERLRAKGAAFDYYVPDWGWSDRDLHLNDFHPTAFPNGPREVVRKVAEGGMQFGLWFPVSHPPTAFGSYPAELLPCVIPAPGGHAQGEPRPAIYRHGYPVSFGMQRPLCVASEPYFSRLRGSIEHHMRENQVRFVKLDMGVYYCNHSGHGHLPGKYSVEAIFDRLIELAATARRVAPAAYVMWYWGLRSPFWGLHGDSIFESGLHMEGSATSVHPSLFYRDSVTLAVDQNTSFARYVAPIHKDSLGVWLADNRWGNFMGTERWREALVMDLGRGNLLFPQIWGDLYLLNDEDIAFLAEMGKLARDNADVLAGPRQSIGDPWKNDVYGYAYGRGSRGFVFLNNVHFAPRETKFRVDGAAQLISRFPDRQCVVRPAADGAFKLWLRPFEVVLLEVAPATSTPEHKLSEADAAALGAPLQLAPTALPGDMNLIFADAAQLERKGHRKKAHCFRTTLPELGADISVLAVAVRLGKGGHAWRYAPFVLDIVQMMARLGDRRVQMVPVPDARQFGNTQSFGSCWTVFKMRVGRHSSGRPFEFAVHTYLPDGVEAGIEAWVVSQWWDDRRRALPDGSYAEARS